VVQLGHSDGVPVAGHTSSSQKEDRPAQSSVLYTFLLSSCSFPVSGDPLTMAPGYGLLPFFIYNLLNCKEEPGAVASLTG
jgi:hypothetical protein